MVGLCRSDIKEVQGARPVRSDFGHELVGIVHDSSSTGAFKPGTSLVFDPHVQLERTSGFATHVRVTAPEATIKSAFHVIPDNMPAERAVFAEPLACAIHACRRLLQEMANRFLSKMDLGIRVGIVGAGTAAVLQALYLRDLGFQVVLLNRGRTKLDFFRATGLAGGVGTLLMDEVGSCRFDAVLLSTTFSTPELIQFSMRLVRPGGVLLLFGGTKPRQGAAGLDVDALRRSEGCAKVTTEGGTVLLAGTYGAAREDFTEAILVAAKLPLEKLVSDKVPLRQLPELLVALAAGKRELVGKTLVRT